MPQKGTEQPNATTGKPPCAHFPKKLIWKSRTILEKNVRLTCMFVRFTSLIRLIGS